MTCPPAPHVMIVTFQSMTTYMRGGILIEGGAPPFPAASHSAGHGIWERTGHHTFRLFFRAHNFDQGGHLVSIVEVESHPKLIQGDNPATPDVVEPYYLSGEGTNRITNLNPVNGLVINVTHGCNEATSRPIFFEDLSEDYDGREGTGTASPSLPFWVIGVMAVPGASWFGNHATRAWSLR